MSDSGEGIDAEIDAAIADEVGPRIEARRTNTASRAREGVEAAVHGQTDDFVDEPRGDWHRIGNSRFVATDGLGGEVRVRHEGDVDVAARLGVDKARLWSREKGLHIDVDHEPGMAALDDQSVRSQAGAGVEAAVHRQTTFPDEAFAVYDLDAAGFVGEGFFHQTVFETEQAAREVARGDDDRLVVRVAPLDTEHPQIGRGDDEVTPERCEPLLKITMRIQGDPTDPETRLAIEEQLGDTIGYINRRIFTTAVEGPALNNNFVVFVQLSPAETWTSIDRKVQRLYEWAGGSGFIDDVGRHVAVTLDGGDPELSVRAEPGAV